MQVANQIGVDLKTCAESLSKYEGIYRRHQILGQKNGVWVIDDYAHNPAKCAASIKACQPLAEKVVAWFQPHGYGPTRFLRQDFVEEISNTLRENDEIWMSEIFYAGGTAVKDISANDLIEDIKAKGKKAFFVEDRNQFLETVKPSLSENSVLLLMGARNPSLEEFCKELLRNCNWSKIKISDFNIRSSLCDFVNFKRVPRNERFVNSMNSFIENKKTNNDAQYLRKTIRANCFCSKI